MKKKRNTRSKVKVVEILLVIISLGGIAFAAQKLFEEMSLSFEKADEKPIMVVASKQNTAQRRFQKKNLWEQLKNSTLIYKGDRIRTGSLSEVVLFIPDTKAYITLGENSLTQLDFGGSGEYSFNFIEGSLEVKTDSEESNISVRTGDTILNFSDSTQAVVNMKKSEKNKEAKATVAVTSGSVNVYEAPLEMPENDEKTVQTGKNPVRALVQSATGNNGIFGRISKIINVNQKEKEGISGNASAENASEQKANGNEASKKYTESKPVETVTAGKMYVYKTEEKSDAAGKNAAEKDKAKEDEIEISAPGSYVMHGNTGSVKVPFFWSSSRPIALEFSNDPSFSSIIASQFIDGGSRKANIVLDFANAGQNVFWRAVSVDEKPLPENKNGVIFIKNDEQETNIKSIVENSFGENKVRKIEQKQQSRSENEKVNDGQKEPEKIAGNEKVYDEKVDAAENESVSDKNENLNENSQKQKNALLANSDNSFDDLVPVNIKEQKEKERIIEEKKKQEEAEQKRIEAQKKAEEQKRKIEEKKAAEERKKKLEEEKRIKAEQEAKRKAEAEKEKKRLEAEKQKKIEAQKKAEAEKKRQEEEARQKKLEEERRKKAELEAKQRIEAEKERKRLEEENRKKLEAQKKAEEEKRKKEEEARLKKLEEEKRIQAELEAKQKAEAEKERKRLEEEARIKAEQDAKEKAKQEARQKIEAEKERKRIEEENRKKLEAQKKAEEEKRKKEEEARIKAEEEARIKAEQEAQRIAEEEKEKQRLEEEKKLKAEQEARKQANQANARKRLEEKLKKQEQARQLEKELFEKNKEIPVIAKPSLISPAQDTVFTENDFDSDSRIIFQWSPVENASYYKFIMYQGKKSDGKKIASYKVTGNTFTVTENKLSLIDNGPVTWEVCAVAQINGKEYTGKSSTGEFTVNMSALDAVSIDLSDLLVVKQ